MFGPTHKSTVALVFFAGVSIGIQLYPGHVGEREVDIGIVLGSAANLFAVWVPNDSTPYKISSLVSSPTLPATTIDQLNFDTIHLLNDDRGIIERQDDTITLGGGLPMYQVASPPQPILSVTCGSPVEKW
ncbi:hypothetical protein LTR80_011660 [Exophiala xenobiotica]